MKKRIGILGASLLALTLAACGSGAAGQAQYIGLDAAKAVALEAAGIQEGEASFSTTGLDKQNGIDFYAVDFTANGQSYEYDIDAVTGVIIDSDTPDTRAAAAAGSGAEASPSPSASPEASPSASPEAAATPSPSPAATPSPAAGEQTGLITADQAKAAALAHAGLTSGQVTVVKCKLDWEDGRQVYEVEFYDSDYTEYDYEIDAATGSVLKYDYDAEYVVPNTSGSQSITADQAKALALAQVPGATTADIYEFEVDYDDGRVEYEGEIYYNGMKYEFQIDGHSGSIREWEAEPAGH